MKKGKTERGKYPRKRRRIDYSKEEVSKMAGYAPTTLDEKIKEFCKSYGFPDGAFKQVDHTGRNFFPPEYAPLLALLMKFGADNPGAIRRKGGLVTAEAVAEYNREICSGIEESEETAFPLKCFFAEMPWYRTAKIMSSDLSALVRELRIFIYNLLFTKGTDVGQGVKLLTRELENMNFHMYLGKFVRDVGKKSSMDKDQEIRAEIGAELDGMTEEERQEQFRECPQFEDMWLEYTGKLDPAATRIDERSLSVDWGIANAIRLMMRRYKTEILQEGSSTLSEFLTDEEVAQLKKELEEAGRPETPEAAERALYLMDMDTQDELIRYLRDYRTPGVMDFVVRNGKNWKSHAQSFEDGEPVEIAPGQELPPKELRYKKRRPKKLRYKKLSPKESRYKKLSPKESRYEKRPPKGPRYKKLPPKEPRYKKRRPKKLPPKVLRPEDKLYTQLKDAYLHFIEEALSREYLEKAVSALVGSVLAEYFYNSGKI